MESSPPSSRREAAGDRDVFIGGGADVINQFLAPGLLDEPELHVVPILLGGGERLFDGVGPNVKLEQLRSVEAPGVTHLKSRRVLMAILRMDNVLVVVEDLEAVIVFFVELGIPALLRPRSREHHRRAGPAAQLRASGGLRS